MAVGSEPRRRLILGEYEDRLARLDALRSAGVDPYPAQVGQRTPIAAVLEEWGEADTEKLETEKPPVAVAGRVVGRRSFGKLLFFDLLENGHRIQVSARKPELPPELFAFLKEVDLGDFLRFEGFVWRTRTGELTVSAMSAELLSKALRPLPEKWHGLQDVEARFRQRHLDLLVNPTARESAITRSRTVTAMRSFLDGRDFLEVETPVLQPLYGGASARPFTTHHNSYDQQLYLRISDELYLKRLIVAGLDRVYEIGHNFRNEGVSRKHNPEFTMMECYQAYADYRDMMDLAEALVKEVAERVVGNRTIEYQGLQLDLGVEFARETMRDAIAERSDIDIAAASDLGSLGEALKAKGISLPEAPTWGVLVDELFSEFVEPKLQQPTFIVDYPVELSPLAKKSPGDPRFVERFELFVAGFELGNAFSELNDPIDQRARFETQVAAAAAGDEEAQPLDEDYLAALESGMPPTGGFGMGVDRLVMVLADAPSLREVLLYPHMKPRD